MLDMYYEEMGELLYDDEIFARLVLDDGTETNYLVSNYGRVWSENVNRYLSLNIDKRSGRKRFDICVNGICTTIYLARAIALSFLGNGSGLEADHIDNDCTNDILENIQWLTPEENKKKAHSSGKINYKGSDYGDNSNFHVYNESDIHVVCSLMEQGKDMKYISSVTGVSLAVIQSIKSHKNWTEVSALYNIDNVTPTKPKKLPKEINDFIKERIIEGYTNKEIEQLVFETFNEISVYSSITNHKRRMKKQGLI